MRKASVFYQLKTRDHFSSNSNNAQTRLMIAKPFSVLLSRDFKWEMNIDRRQDTLPWTNSTWYIWYLNPLCSETGSFHHAFVCISRWWSRVTALQFNSCSLFPLLVKLCLGLGFRFKMRIHYRNWVFICSEDK